MCFLQDCTDFVKACNYNLNGECIFSLVMEECQKQKKTIVLNIFFYKFFCNGKMLGLMLGDDIVL